MLASRFSQRVGLSQHSRLRQPPITQQRSPVRCHAVSKQDVIDQVATEIVETEQELAAMFSPGRAMPPASVVAGVRGTIAALKRQLAQMLVEEGVAEVSAVDEKLLKDVELSIQRKSGVAMTHDIMFEVTLLETQNEALRKEAEALLTRQAQLEELCGKHGVRIPSAVGSAELTAAMTAAVAASTAAVDRSSRASSSSSRGAAAAGGRGSGNGNGSAAPAARPTPSIRLPSSSYSQPDVSKGRYVDPLEAAVASVVA